MTGRPALDVAVRRNGGSFKVFESGQFVGSISGRKLLEVVRNKRPGVISAQEVPEALGSESGTFRPVLQDDAEGRLE